VRIPAAARSARSGFSVSGSGSPAPTRASPDVTFHSKSGRSCRSAASATSAQTRSSSGLSMAMMA